MNVKVEQDLSAKLPSVPCDVSQVQQVVLNLVMNAAEVIEARHPATTPIDPKF
jgi:nitrogen-specific signal transduction histidine kinase